MHVLVLEDQVIYTKLLIPVILSIFPEAEIRIESSVCINGQLNFDLAILDIELENSLDGIQFMRMYGKQIPVIIFYSVCTHRIKESFGKNVIGFVQKGEEETLLREKLWEAKDILSQIPTVWLLDENKRRIPLHPDQLSSCSRVSRIFWFTDRYGNKYRTKSGRLEKWDWLNELFVRINQSELINMQHIQSIDGDEITMQNGTRLYISRRFLKEFERKICL